ncbi:MAG: hypothetical protein KDB82_13955 [Planctomycetes bacterium]|nr:hypothetical protein [Planctomycetota bacterium]
MQLFLGTLTRYYTEVQPLDDPEVVVGAVSAWRHWLNKELPHALDWDESPTAPFDEAEVGDKCVGALWLLAAYAGSDAELPVETPDDWRADARVQQAKQSKPGGMFMQVVKPNLWLPGEHDFLFQARELDERLNWIGSSEELLRELEAMERHWKSELESRPGLADDFGHAREIIEPLARRSVEFGLPLRLIPG